MQGCRARNPLPRSGKGRGYDSQDEEARVHLVGHESFWSFSEARIFFAGLEPVRHYLVENRCLLQQMDSLERIGAVGSIQLLPEKKRHEDAPSGYLQNKCQGGTCSVTQAGRLMRLKGLLIMLLRWAS